jgi:hypothetical protein
MVRCGSCKQVFNGIEHLVRADAAPPPPPPASPPKPSAAPPIAPDQPMIEAAAVMAHDAPMPPVQLEEPLPPVQFEEPLPLVRHDEHEEPAPPVAIDPSVPPEQADANANASVALATIDPDFDALLMLPAYNAEPVHRDDGRIEPSFSMPFADDHAPPSKQAEPQEEDAATEQPDQGQPTATRSRLRYQVQPLTTPLVMPSAADVDEHHQPKQFDRFDADDAHEAGADAGREDTLSAGNDIHSGRNAEQESNQDSKQNTEGDSGRNSGAASDPDNELPGFVKRARKQQKAGRVWRVLAAFLSLILFLGMVGQATYAFRNLLAAYFPQAKPLLVHACTLLKCKVEFPTQIKKLSIESGVLQVLPRNQDTYSYTSLLRNDSALVQSWPNIELTLTDAHEKAIARRIFTKHDYMGSAASADKGFAPNSEQVVKLYFELNQLQASGYRVALFYP